MNHHYVTISAITNISTNINNEHVQPNLQYLINLHLASVWLIFVISIGISFFKYKRATIWRRIEHRMNINKFDDMADYVRYLDNNPAEV